MSLTYQEAGVDTNKAERVLSRFGSFLKDRPKNPHLLSGIGPFASCFSLKEILRDYDDPLLVTACDGIGTKLKLALDWGDISRLGEDLVAMNVNDLLCVGATPLVFLDYFACGSLVEDQLLTLLKSIQVGCELAGCSLAGGETAEMPGLYQEKDFDLGGFSVGLVDRAKVLGGERVRPGDVLIALSSSGLHSNGYSLVRKLIDKTQITPDGLTPFGTGTWRETLLKPTLIYVSALKPLLPRLSGLAHLTGEGLLGNLPRVLPSGTKAVVRSKDWKLPPLFDWIQKEANLPIREMLNTFNCGVGMMAVANPSQSDSILKHLENTGIQSWVIGEVQKTSESEPFVDWIK
ncbi:MAG: phosphoribosylformylglycinamidine cyclo-ligase [Proteobacteria bacterium]|nr:phosphoribosylformylglycinamidine cyclo-ligase [Pseudomonadota bacterium]